MPNTRDINLEEYQISKYRYRELKNFCLQYREKQSRLLSLTEIGSPSTEATGGGGTSDRTSTMAIKRMELQHDIALIEQTAMETNADIYPYIINHVADGIPYEYMDVPMGRRQFYDMRKKFFFLLSQKKG